MADNFADHLVVHILHEDDMKKEVNPAVFIAVIVLIAVGAIFWFWRSAVPEGVKTEKPTAPNPPGSNVSLPPE